jgi:hypothetical protein
MIPQASPTIKLRDGAKSLLDALSKDGFITTGRPRISLVDDCIYIEINTNCCDKNGNVKLAPIEVFIPVPQELLREFNENNKTEKADTVTDSPASDGEQRATQVVSEGVCSGDTRSVDGPNEFVPATTSIETNEIVGEAL